MMGLIIVEPTVVALSGASGGGSLPLLDFSFTHIIELGLGYNESVRKTI
jgi:hypothetical protein